MKYRSVSGRNWILENFDEKKVKKKNQDLGVSEIVSRLLTIRNIPSNECKQFLNPKIKNTMPNPFILKSMDLAVNVLIKNIKFKKKICIFGDYDVDGACSTAIIAKYLKSLNCDFSIFIPDRIKDGYGPSLNTFNKIIEKKTNLIITVDCGTTSFDQIQYAKSKGLDIIVLDHHQSNENLPNADAVVNPNRFDEVSDLKYLCAAGVSFLFLTALSSKLRNIAFFEDKNIKEPDLLNFLDLVAFGTICDVVPLVGLNRSLVSQGLKVIANRNNLGLKTLSDLSKINEKIETYHVGYILGPKINAGGRIGKSDYGTNLLLTEDPQIAYNLSLELSSLNEKRKNIEGIILEEAITEAKKKDNLPIILIKSNNWHEGIIGIIASRIKEQFNKPALIVNVEGSFGKGSARSIPGFDIGTSIIYTKQLGIIERGGGHKMAGGFSIDMKNYENFEKEMIKLYQKSGCLTTREKDLFIDSVISESAINEEFFNEIKQLAPFGSGNREPRFLIKNIKIIKSIKLKDVHIKAFCKTQNNKNFNVISFNSSQNEVGSYLLNSANKSFNLAGRLSLSNWNGKRTIDFILDDLAIL